MVILQIMNFILSLILVYFFNIHEAVSYTHLGLVYYNYRHLNPHDGRWISRDPIAVSYTHLDVYKRQFPESVS